MKNLSSWRCASPFVCTVTGGMRGSLILNSSTSPMLKHTWSAGRAVTQCDVTVFPSIWESTSRPMLARWYRFGVWNVRSTSAACSPYRGNQLYEVLTYNQRSGADGSWPFTHPGHCREMPWVIEVYPMRSP